MLKTTSDQLESKLGMIYIKSDPSKKISIKEVAGKTVAKGHQILGTGSRKSNFSAKGVSFHTWSAQAAEIEVNTLTGTIKVLKVAGAHELGKAINPLVCDGQWEGGIAMGLGYTIFEERIIDKATGIMVNPDFHQYKIVTSLDMPEVIPMYVEEEDPYFGYSAKGIGEPTCVATPAAIANAFFNATGIRMKELPMLPEKVLEALSKKAREG
jgi:CO/xanthine dehydrogenase Mo-binding subunit